MPLRPPAQIAQRAALVKWRADYEDWLMRYCNRHKDEDRPPPPLAMAAIDAPTVKRLRLRPVGIQDSHRS
jgi:hypothetical protein